MDSRGCRLVVPVDLPSVAFSAVSCAVSIVRRGRVAAFDGLVALRVHAVGAGPRVDGDVRR